jgi:AcrR family transcriptional regulator
MTKRTQNPRRSRQDWISAARNALIARGIDAVKIQRLARALHVSRSGFYWHFKNRKELLRALLESWERDNTKPFEQAIRNDASSGETEFEAIANMWLQEKDYKPSYDIAVRNWARISKQVASVVRRVDLKRIEILRTIFRDMGFDDAEAFIRARVSYLHQVGYYTLDLGETKAQRKKLAPLYVTILTGKSIHGFTM